MRKIILILLIGLLIFQGAYASSDDPSIWAEDFITELEAYGEIRSDMFTNYKYDITRAEFIYLTVKMIEIVQDKPVSINSDIYFTDTTDVYALKGASIGITSGIGNNQFGPDMLLTREQMATLLLNTLTIMDMKTVSNVNYSFNDEANFSSWAKDAIYLVKANDIMNGVGNDNFDATGKTTKEAALVVVTKLIRKNIHKFDSAFISSMEKTDMETDVMISATTEVSMNSITSSSKPSVNSLTFSYAQKNISAINMPESSLRVYFSDGSSELIKGFSRFIEPGSTKIRTLSLDFDKSKTPLFVIAETDIIDINLNLKTMPKWLIN